MSGGGQSMGGDPRVMMKEAGNESGHFPPEPPGGGSAALPNQAPPQGSLNATTPGLGIQQPFGFYGRPHQQTYGGLPAPYANVHDQFRDLLNMQEMGPGRFANNAAARYNSFAGWNGWRPDAMTQPGPPPTQTYGPKPPLTPPPVNAAPPGAPPGGPPPGTVTKPPPKVGGGDQMAQFQQALNTNPYLAKAMMEKDVPWFMQNKDALSKMVGGDLQSWRNKHDSAMSNALPVSDPAQMAMLAAFGRR